MVNTLQIDQVRTTRAGHPVRNGMECLVLNRGLGVKKGESKHWLLRRLQLMAMSFIKIFSRTEYFDYYI